MKTQLIKLLEKTITNLKAAGELPAEIEPNITIEKTRDPEHGDFASNIALSLAKACKMPPRQLAEKIVTHIQANDVIKKIDIAGPGFINFHLAASTTSAIIQTILEQGENFGKSTFGNGARILVEFVSVNPTGPLHVGHGRQAAYGASVANLLEAAGFNVYREYYVNDAGRQMRILAASLWLRYLEQIGAIITFPSNGYQGDYLVDIAKLLHEKYTTDFSADSKTIFSGLPPDDDGKGNGDKEAHIDAIIERAIQLLGDERFTIIQDFALTHILDDIRNDLSEFGVAFDNWFSEKTLFSKGLLDKALSQLKQSKYVYEKEGATWFKSSELGDEKDRVLIRENGLPTYFMPDIAYHLNKFERGHEHLLDIFGADHHGYYPRMRAAIMALGKNPEHYTAEFIQFVSLYRGKEKVKMSTRSGSFITLRELRATVGNDAARFFYIMRKQEQHLDFDLELATAKSNENPVYYIQYAHARICSVMRQLNEKNKVWTPSIGFANTHLLTETAETALITALSQYPDIIQKAANAHTPHTLAHYLRDLANFFHAYYNAYQFIVEDENLLNARLCLINATKQVLVNGLKLLGISTPESM